MSRQVEIAEQVSLMLRRYSPPRDIAGDMEAQAQELDDWVELLNRYAPIGSHVEWVKDVLHRLRLKATTRVWPTIGELNKVCTEKRQNEPRRDPAPTQQAVQDSHYQIVATKMMNGDAVGEGYLYGVEAVELLKRGLVTTDILSRYRSNAYFARVRQYGEDVARQWETERKAAHKSAWDGYDAVQRQRAEKASFNHRPLPYRPDFAA